MIYVFGGAFDPPHIGHAAIVRALLHYKNPTKILIIPSGKRDDKCYHVCDEDRLTMLKIFTQEIGDVRVEVDDFFVRHWQGEMITRDVDEYVRERYQTEVIHVFSSDCIEGMYHWDREHVAAEKIKKLFIPRRENAGETILSKEAYTQKILENGIQNFEVWTASHFPSASSTALRKSIPAATGFSALYEGNPKFIIPGLSGRLSRHILEKRLYRPYSDCTRSTSYAKPWLLVHICCGPDATMPILQLRNEYNLLCFWYDPNIEPKKEYEKRFRAFQKVCEIEGVPYIQGAYDVGHFHKRIRGLEHTPEKGEKCTHCYDMRMYVAAKLAKRLGISLYTSSLNTSPKKDLERLFYFGHAYARHFSLEFLDIPFRKRGGFSQSVQYTKKHDIYRQRYCGCIYSLLEGGGGGG